MVVPPNVWRSLRALAHVNRLHSDLTPALSRHLPGIIKVILEPMVCDSFKNVHQYTDEALKRAHLCGVQMRGSSLKKLRQNTAQEEHFSF